VQDLNDIAEQQGLSAIAVKCHWRSFQRLLKKLQNRRLDEAVLARLRSVTKQWSENGGHLEGVLVAPPAEAEQAEDGAAVSEPLLAHHKVLVPTFRLES
jgi:hypothetical protein